MEFLRLIVAAVLITASIGCSNNPQMSESNNLLPSDSTSLRTELKFEPIKYIRGAINHNTTDYYVQNGTTKGFHHDILKHYANSRGHEIELNIINEDYDTITELLINDMCDIVAMNVSPKSIYNPGIFYSDPIIHNDIVIVTPRDNKKSIKELIAGKYVSVKRNSVAAEALYTYRDTCGFYFGVVELPTTVTSEDMFNDVANGLFAGTVNYKHKSRTACYRIPTIEIKQVIEKRVPICWEFRTENHRDDFNSWLSDFKKRGNIAYLYRYYYRDSGADHIKRYREIYSPNLSEYDDIFKRESSVLNWDWRLVAAVAFTESQFKDTIESAQGAYGLMQILPVTAEQFGVGDYFRADSNIYVGVRYLAFLDKFFARSINNPNERIHFTLAAYNAGFGHIQDAMRLAKEYGYRDTIWSNNVENFLLIKSQPQFQESPAVRNGKCDGKQSVDFVRRVLRSYRSYTQTKKM